MSGTIFLILLGERLLFCDFHRTGSCYFTIIVAHILFSHHRTITCYLQSSQNTVLRTVITARYLVMYNHRTMSRYVYSSSHNIVLFTINVAHVIFPNHRTITCYLRSSHSTVLCTVITAGYRVMHNFPRPSLTALLTSTKAGGKICEEIFSIKL
jgi:hypothetical protein